MNLNTAGRSRRYKSYLELKGWALRLGVALIGNSHFGVNSIGGTVTAYRAGGNNFEIYLIDVRVAFATPREIFIVEPVVFVVYPGGILLRTFFIGGFHC